VYATHIRIKLVKNTIESKFSMVILSICEIIYTYKAFLGKDINMKKKKKKKDFI
jgi:hypothetical protein